MGSLKSGLQFLSYKVDNIKLHMRNTLRMLGASFDQQPEWKFRYGVSQPLYIKSEDVYVSGVTVIAVLGKVKKPDVKLEMSISGIFKLIGDPEKKQREEFVKVQMPAILSPYVRSAITYVLAMAGFGQVIPPLVNYRQIAEDLLKDKPILVQEGASRPDTKNDE